jgi:hypothetical protein
MLLLLSALAIVLVGVWLCCRVSCCRVSVPVRDLEAPPAPPPLPPTTEPYDDTDSTNARAKERQQAAAHDATVKLQKQRARFLGFFTAPAKPPL